MAGTGNDYIGKVNVTRSNRTCQVWLTPVKNITKIKASKNSTVNSPSVVTRNIRYHHVDTKLLDGSLYADMSAEAALNYCRNPSRSIAG